MDSNIHQHPPAPPRSMGPEDAHLGADSIGWQALAPALACTILATIVVAARWYSRCRIARCLGVDDYVILLSLLLAWAMTTTIALAVHTGIGHYDTPAEASRIALYILATNTLWICTVNITKTSLLTQYLRIFLSPRLRTAIYALLLLALPAAAGYSIFAGIFLCSPTATLWSPEQYPNGTCRSAQTYWLSVAGLDIGLDFVVLLLPLPAILRLRLPSRRQKVALVAVFTLGFAVCLVSVARLLTVLFLAQRGRFVESGVWAVIWSSVEANVGIVCACLLALKPLAVKLCPRGWWEGRGEEGGKLPKHAMWIPRVVDTSGARWSQVRFPEGLDRGSVVLAPEVGGEGVGKEACSAWRGSGSTLLGTASAGSGVGGRDAMDEVPRAMWVPPAMRHAPEEGLSEVESGVGVVQREPGQQGGELVGEGTDEKVSIWDMLKQPEGAPGEGSR